MNVESENEAHLLSFPQKFLSKLDPLRWKTTDYSVCSALVFNVSLKHIFFCVQAYYSYPIKHWFDYLFNGNLRLNTNSFFCRKRKSWEMHSIFGKSYDENDDLGTAELQAGIDHLNAAIQEDLHKHVHMPTASHLE